LPEELKRTLGKLNNLSFTVFLAVVVRVNLCVCNSLDHLYDLLRLPDEAD
jgi:hypothetical protein